MTLSLLTTYELFLFPPIDVWLNETIIDSTIGKGVVSQFFTPVASMNSRRKQMLPCSPNTTPGLDWRNCSSSQATTPPFVPSCFAVPLPNPFRMRCLIDLLILFCFLLLIKLFTLVHVHLVYNCLLAAQVFSLSHFLTAQTNINLY